MSALPSLLVLVFFIATGSALGDPFHADPYAASKKQNGNQCKLYTTDMAYYGGKAAVMGCSADLILACEKELRHFDAYNVHAYGGSAHVEYVDVAGYGAKNFYMIGININCKYTGKVEVKVDITGIYVAPVHFHKLPCTPVKSTGSVNDHSYKKHSGSLHFDSKDRYYLDPFDHSYASTISKEYGPSNSRDWPPYIKHEENVYHHHSGQKENHLYAEGKTVYNPHEAHNDDYIPTKHVAHVPLYHDHEAIHPFYDPKEDEAYLPAKHQPYTGPAYNEDDWYNAYIHKHHGQGYQKADSYQTYTPSGYIKPAIYPEEQHHAHVKEPYYHKEVPHLYTPHVESEYRDHGSGLHNSHEYRLTEYGSENWVQKRDSHDDYLPAHSKENDYYEHDPHDKVVLKTKKYENVLKGSLQPWVELPSIPKTDISEYHEEPSYNGYSPVKIPDLKAFLSTSPLTYGK